MALTQKIPLLEKSKRLKILPKVDWQEQHKMLRISFNTSTKSLEAFFDTQFGYLKKPTHKNTNWEVVKFESIGH